jgi:hypothetical protein
LATAAVSCKRVCWPIANQPQLAASRIGEVLSWAAGGLTIRRRLNNLPHKLVKFVAAREEVNM